MKLKMDFIEDCTHCIGYSSGCCRRVPSAAGIGENYLKTKTFPHWCPLIDVPETKKTDRPGTQFSDAPPSMYN